MHTLKAAKDSGSNRSVIGCDRHGEGQIPYVVCTHVAYEGVYPSVIFTHSDDNNGVGEALCPDCQVFFEDHKDNDLPTDQDLERLVLICLPCLQTVIGRIPCR